MFVFERVIWTQIKRLKQMEILNLQRKSSVEYSFIRDNIGAVDLY